MEKPNSKTNNEEIRQFYEAYHQRRERKADRWVQAKYWPLFRGKTFEVGAGTLLPTYQPFIASDITYEATRRALQAGIPSVMADGLQLPFASQVFDTVACYDVLEHVLDPDRFLAELCRVSRSTVIVAGPNYIGQDNGGLDRHFLQRLWAHTIQHRQGYVIVDHPHLNFDDHWQPDMDAVCKPNAGYVARQLRNNGFKVEKLYSWEHAYPFLNYVPVVRCLGQFMLIVGRR